MCLSYLYPSPFDDQSIPPHFLLVNSSLVRCRWKDYSQSIRRWIFILIFTRLSVGGGWIDREEREEEGGAGGGAGGGSRRDDSGEGGSEAREGGFQQEGERVGVGVEERKHFEEGENGVADLAELVIIPFPFFTFPESSRVDSRSSHHRKMRICNFT